MSSEIIVVLVLVALAVGFLIWLETHSRRNKGKADEQEHLPETVESQTQETTNTGGH